MQKFYILYKLAGGWVFIYRINFILFMFSVIHSGSNKGVIDLKFPREQTFELREDFFYF